jgi:hypothetical protein
MIELSGEIQFLTGLSDGFAEIFVALRSIAIETEFSLVTVGVSETCPDPKTSFLPETSEGEPET